MNPFEELGRRNAGANFSTNPFSRLQNTARPQQAATNPFMAQTPKTPMQQMATQQMAGPTRQMDRGAMQQMAGPTQQAVSAPMQQSVDPRMQTQTGMQQNPFMNVPAGRGGPPAEFGDRYFNPYQVPSVYIPPEDLNRSEPQNAFLAAHLGISPNQGMNRSLYNNAGDWAGQYDAQGYPIMSQGYYQRHDLQAPTSADQNWGDRGYVPYQRQPQGPAPTRGGTRPVGANRLGG